MGDKFVGLVVTQEILTKAVLMGACSNLPKIGTEVSDISQESLMWAERLGLKTEIPLWALSKGGSGYGDGHCYGYGDGDGDGSGYGYGSGDGSGYGDCYGYGYGHGYGDGSGYGHGYGDGSGYGDGHCYGSGSGYGDGYGHGEKLMEVLGLKFVGSDN